MLSRRRTHDFVPPRAVELRFSDGRRPDWLLDDASCRVPLPPGRPRELPGEPLVYGRDGAHEVPLISQHEGEVHAAYDWRQWRRFVARQVYAAPHKRPLFTRLPVHYHHAPAILRNLAAELLAPSAEEGATPFPGYPIEQGFEALRFARQVAKGEGTKRDGHVVLTHDVDTSAGLEWVRDIAELEMAFGFRSQWNIVGCHYPLDYRTLDWLVDNGHEIGLHGFNHDCKLAFLSDGEIRRRFDRCQTLMARYDMLGFRSPGYYRSFTLSRVVRDYFEYDLTFLDADWICVGGKGGCLSARPFVLDGVAIIPTTMSTEYMMTPGGLKVGYDADYWRQKARWLRAVGGDAVVNTHSEPNLSGNERGLGAYRSLLEDLNVVFEGSWALPRELLDDARGDVL